jgi:hypothetical protein
MYYCNHLLLKLVEEVLGQELPLALLVQPQQYPQYQRVPLLDCLVQ